METRIQIDSSQRNLARAIVDYFDVFPRVAPATQGLDIGYPVAAAQGQRDDVVRRKRGIFVSASKADVAVPFAKRLELCGGVSTLAFETHRPVAISLSGGLKWVLLSPLLQVAREVCFPSGRLISTPLYLCYCCRRTVLLVGPSANLAVV